MVTLENYEEYMIMHGDGELSQEEEHALMQYINERPELKSELALYNAARYTPDEKVVYEGKEQLLKQITERRTAFFPAWQKYSIAAGIAVIVFISILKWGAKQNQDNPVVVNNANSRHIVTDQKHTPVAQPVTDTNKAVTAAGRQDGIGIDSRRVAAKNSKEEVITGIGRRSHKTAKDTAIPDNAPVMARTEIEELPPAPLGKIPADLTDETAKPIAAEAYRPLSAKADKGGFFNNFPLDDANRGQIKTISKTVAGARKQLKGIHISIDQETIAVNF